jgi:hypothetical protein
MNINKLIEDSNYEEFQEELSDYIYNIEEYAKREYRTELSYLMYYHELTLADLNLKFIGGHSPRDVVDELMFREQDHKRRAYVTSLMTKPHKDH